MPLFYIIPETNCPDSFCITVAFLHRSRILLSAKLGSSLTSYLLLLALPSEVTEVAVAAAEAGAGVPGG